MEVIRFVYDFSLLSSNRRIISKQSSEWWYNYISDERQKGDRIEIEERKTEKDV